MGFAKYTGVSQEYAGESFDRLIKRDDGGTFDDYTASWSIYKDGTEAGSGSGDIVDGDISFFVPSDTTAGFLGDYTLLVWAEKSGGYKDVVAEYKLEYKAVQ